jgi:hypothetical protein
MDEEIRQALSEVREMKQMCGNINMKLTNIVTQRGQNWKEKLEAEYHRGLEDAWEAARKIGHASQMKLKEMAFDFTDKDWCYNPSWYVVMNYTASEAIAKLKAYEEKQKADDEINVGDEVRHDDGHIFVATAVDNISVYGIDGTGDFKHSLKCNVHRTDRHFDISSILKEMQSQ